MKVEFCLFGSNVENVVTKSETVLPSDSAIIVKNINYTFIITPLFFFLMNSFALKILYYFQNKYALLCRSQMIARLTLVLPLQPTVNNCKYYKLYLIVLDD